MLYPLPIIIDFVVSLNFSVVLSMLSLFFNRIFFCRTLHLSVLNLILSDWFPFVDFLKKILIWSFSKWAYVFIHRFGKLCKFDNADIAFMRVLLKY